MSAAVSIRIRRSKGAVMLSRLGTQPKIAALVGANEVLVGYWMRGDRVPPAHWRLVLWQALLIPPGMWDLPPTSPLSCTPSLRRLMALELEQWPEARARADALLKKWGST